MLRLLALPALLILTGCVHTTEHSDCPAPPKPEIDSRLLAPACELVAADPGDLKTLLPVATANNACSRETRERYIELQKRVEALLNE